MTDVKRELYLNALFFIEGIAGGLIRDEKTIVDKLSDIFLATKSETDEIIEILKDEGMKEIKNYGDFARFCRIRQYYELCGYDLSEVEMTDAIAVKGSVFRQLKKYGYEAKTEATNNLICEVMTEKANAGHIASLITLGFLQCEGIFVNKNLQKGIKNLEKAAKWNSVEGILFSLYYNCSTRKNNLNRLYTVTKGVFKESIFKEAAARYNGEVRKIVAESEILQKSFAAGILNPDLYASQYSRFIYSEILNAKDKERALFSGHKEVISQTADLPLKLKYDDLSIDVSAIEKSPLAREKERDVLRRVILNSDMRGESFFRPPLLVSDSDFLIKEYMRLLGNAFPQANVETIDVSDLTDYDFEPTQNNVFVRSCDEDKQNVYLLYCRGEIKESAKTAVKNFIQGEKRRKMRLQHPGAVIDLSVILPICFCDSANVGFLAPYCDELRLAPVSKSEKPAVIESILKSKTERYNYGSIKADDGAKDILIGFSIDKACNVIDRLSRLNRGEENLVINADMVRESLSGESTSKVRYGFGGAINDNK